MASGGFDLDGSAKSMRDLLKKAQRVEVLRRDGETSVIADGEAIGLLTSVRLRKSASGAVWLTAAASGAEDWEDQKTDFQLDFALDSAVICLSQRGATWTPVLHCYITPHRRRRLARYEDGGGVRCGSARVGERGGGSPAVGTAACCVPRARP